MKKTLIIGWSKGNIADTFIDTLTATQPHDTPRRIRVAAKEDLDVSSDMEVHDYIVHHGPFDEIVYCAAINRLGWLPGMLRTDLEEVFAVNYFGWVSVIAHHLDYFPEKRFRAVVLSSDAAKVPMRGSLMYNSSKAALQFSVRNIARELGPRAVIVGVAPCIVDDTPMTEYIDETIPTFRGWTKAEARRYEQSNIPLGRRLTKEEVAQVMVFALVGPEGLTGSTIEITGGK